jgi:ketosteroid isomerase-like protein
LATAATSRSPSARALRDEEYYGDGDRVVILGDETFKVKDTGATPRAEWAWVVDVHDGLITRILHDQDLAGVAGLVREALTKAQSDAVERPTVGSA